MISNILEIGYLIVRKTQKDDCKISIQQWSEGEILKSERDLTEDLDWNMHPSLKIVSRTFYRGSRTTKLGSSL